VSKITNKQKRLIYKIAFGKEYDDKNRKQAPLSLDLAYMVALNKLNTEARTKHIKGGK